MAGSCGVADLASLLLYGACCGGTPDCHAEGVHCRGECLAAAVWERLWLMRWSVDGLIGCCCAVPVVGDCTMEVWNIDTKVLPWGEDDVARSRSICHRHASSVPV